MAYEVGFRGKHFTAVSTDAASHFRRYLKPGAEIAVIPNGLPDSIFEMGSEREQSGNAGTVFATILQGWSRRKNAEAALKAFQIVRREIPDARLMMFGLDYEPGGLAQRWANQNNLDAGVTFVGVLPYQSLLERMQNEVNFVVHPSLDESFSMAALEAMALKKPVIAGRKTPGVREVLGFGNAGILVDMRDPGAIAKEMIRLAQDADYCTDVAESGYARASALYRLKTVMTQYEVLYATLV
jgi:glycosyltransferase involved in cell wall biosynthesis